MTMKTHENENVFSTFDLALATVISLWHPLVDIDKSQNPHRALFIFERSKKLDATVDKYWKRELLIEPRQYFEQLKTLKGRLYAHE